MVAKLTWAQQDSRSLQRVSGESDDLSQAGGSFQVALVKLGPSSPPHLRILPESPQMEILSQEPHSQVKSGFHHRGYC